MAAATLCVPTSSGESDGWESIYTNMKNREVCYTALVVLGELSGFVSILGSAFIIYLVLREKKWRASTFERLIFGLSAADLINSTAIVFQPFLIPKCTGLPFSRGTTTTCRVVGFLGTFLLLSFLYSCTIAIYFLTTLKTNRRAGSTSSCSFAGEMTVHCCLWTYATLYAIFTVVCDLIRPSPFLLTCIPLTPGRDEEYLQWLFQMLYAVVFLFSCPIGFVCTLILYKRLRSISTLLLASDDSDSNPPEAGIVADGYQLSSISLPPRISTNNPASLNTSVTTASDPLQAGGHTTPATTNEDEVKASDDETKDVHFVRDDGGGYVDDGENSQVHMVTIDRRNRFLTQQALWYSFGFMITLVPTLLSVIVEGTLFVETPGQIRDESPLPVMVPISLFLTYTLVPLQGFVNCLIYLRPRLLLWKESYGEHHSWFWVCQQIVACRETPRPTLRTAHLVRRDT